MGKVDDYRLVPQGLPDWDPYLIEHSGLPGPRGNIELGRAAAEEASPERIRAWLEWDHERAPANTAEEFLAFCGVLGFGRLAAEGDVLAVAQLHRHSSDERWRTREAVAMAGQQLADADFDNTLVVIGQWAHDGWLEQRAAVVGVCEPRLLTTQERTASVFAVLDVVTYALATAPAAGPGRMERWIGSADDDVRWVMRNNLSKKRLQRMDGAWAEAQQKRLARP